MQEPGDSQRGNDVTEFVFFSCESLLCELGTRCCGHNKVAVYNIVRMKIIVQALVERSVVLFVPRVIYHITHIHFCRVAACCE